MFHLLRQPKYQLLKSKRVVLYPFRCSKYVQTSSIRNCFERNGITTLMRSNTAVQTRTYVTNSRILYNKRKPSDEDDDIIEDQEEDQIDWDSVKAIDEKIENAFDVVKQGKMEEPAPEEAMKRPEHSSHKLSSQQPISNESSSSTSNPNMNLQKSPLHVVEIIPMQFPTFPRSFLQVSVSKRVFHANRKSLFQQHIGLFMVKKSPKSSDIFDKFEQVGCLAKVHGVTNSAFDDLVVLNVVALKRIKILEPVQTSSDSHTVRVIELEDPPYDANKQIIKAYMMEILYNFKYFTNFPFPLPILQQLPNPDFKSPSQLADLVGGLFVQTPHGTPLEDFQDLLETIDIEERLKKALSIIKTETEVIKLQNKVKKEIDEKYNTNSKRTFLLEQLRIIKKELGLEDEGTEVLVQKYRQKLKDKIVPEAAMKVIEEELQKLSSLEPQTSEFSVTRNYLDWLTVLPWNTYSQDSFDVERAKEILDEDHYGLKKVKERILEFIAVSKLKGAVHGKMLCFVGPPGTGKTSIGKSIARALGREFHRFSVGGMRDYAEIKGHRRTYIGAMPGKLIQIMKLAKYSNPVIMIDEVDKLRSDYAGDPAAALLEVLDPEQNSTFLDHYLDVPYDLSKVLFLCTANMTDTIPEPLLDRMEVIHVSGYIAEEKLQIAKKYLVPKIITETGLKPKQFQLTDGVIKTLIKGYCREAGVRNLQKTIEKVARKIAYELALGKKPQPVTEDNLEQFLGNPYYTMDRYYQQTPVGVCMGLAWTSQGGSAMYIETSIDKGKGKEGSLHCTGNMKDVMKESSAIAYTVAKRILAEKQPDNKFFEETSIHLHTPEGATPKDGPSAGCAMVTALLSLAMNTPIKHNIAMTGEITLTGKVLPVGGIKEKTVGARRAGTKNIIIPKQNKRDWEELLKEAPEVTEGIRVFFADYYDDVYKVCFGDELDKPAPKAVTKPVKTSRRRSEIRV